MKEVVLPENVLSELEDIYDRLQQQYSDVALDLDFSCAGCSDNCCDSYFLHHTYAEWAHLWLGFMQLDPEKQSEVLQRCRKYQELSEVALAAGERPLLMCPLNEDGLCLLYEHRLLVCRTHGVPATITRPDGKTIQFPGCFRCQEIVENRPVEKQCPSVERTTLLTRLAQLENELLDHKRHLMPRVKITIAEMLMKGPPSVPRSHCERERC